VLSTLHTNDCASTVTRLIDMGMEPFNVASAVNLVTAQRLVRKICSACKVPAQYEEEYLHGAKVPMEWAHKTVFYRGTGCDACDGSGYRGRQGLYEVMAMTPEMRRAVMEVKSADDLRDIALSQGMLTLRMDGMKKVERGITTLEEVVKESSDV
jgi:type IV pilus assembly protein PilB